ncbi:MAG: hypothetical protein AB7O04_00230 [Hyphomonadaceae bacterium]
MQKTRALVLLAGHGAVIVFCAQFISDHGEGTPFVSSQGVNAIKLFAVLALIGLGSAYKLLLQKAADAESTLSISEVVSSGAFLLMMLLYGSYLIGALDTV